MMSVSDGVDGAGRVEAITSMVGWECQETVVMLGGVCE